MITITPVMPQNVSAFKSIRLRALKEDPYAFGATYERESQFSESEWLARIERMNREKGVGFLALDSDVACGIVGCFLDEADCEQARVVSMWTAPEHRRQGVGRLLIAAIADWARECGCHTLLLMVTSINETAIRFYEQLGFARTGRTEPYPNDPAITEYEMVLRIL